jgi:hypothetical protein
MHKITLAEMQVKKTLRFYLLPVKLAIMMKTPTNASEDAGE